jgi:HAD superfamily hydrolase (TIGR01509 family)
MKIKAVIFDLDGTIIENTEEYRKSFEEVLDLIDEKQKKPIKLIGGIGVKGEWDVLKKKLKLRTNKTSEELGVLTQQKYLAKLNNIKLKKGIKNFLEKLRNDGVKTALATSNDWSVVDKVLERYDLRDYFDVITTSEEVGYQKPDPGIFNITAEKLELEADDCLVIEDSLSGIMAARDAGMKVIAIAKDKLEGADLLIKDYKDLDGKNFIKTV